MGELAGQYRSRLAAPVDEAKKARLRSAQRAGQIAADADLDLALELLYAPLHQRWLHRSGPLTPEYADALVDLVLKALRPADPEGKPPPRLDNPGSDLARFRR